MESENCLTGINTPGNLKKMEVTKQACSLESSLLDQKVTNNFLF